MLNVEYRTSYQILIAVIFVVTTYDIVVKCMHIFIVTIFETVVVLMYNLSEIKHMFGSVHC